MSKYKREDKAFKASIAARVELTECHNLSHPSKVHRKNDACYKPFPKHDTSIATVTIDENGDCVFLATDANDIFLDIGTVTTTRASHVEPALRYDRWLFHTLRFLFGDKGRISEWTRTWKTLWRVNTKPVGGPILTWAHVAPSPCAKWMDNQVFTTYRRQEAIDAEIKFLNDWFLTR